MASIELQKAVQGYENYINVHGIDEELVKYINEKLEERKIQYKNLFVYN